MAEDFYAELERRNAELEAARATGKEDPEGFNQVAREYSDWRIGIRLLGGRPTGDNIAHPVIAQWLRDHPDHPRTGPMIQVEES